jgi:lipoprotein-anchoring transpeptidase ErfK/SrfK
MRLIFAVFCVLISVRAHAQTLPEKSQTNALDETVSSSYFDDWKDSDSMVLIDTTLKRAWLREGETFLQFPVAVGKASSVTPPGNYKIQQKTRNPWWIPTEDIKKEAEAKGKPLPDRVKPGSKNPLGNYLVRFNGAYAMHGTNQPKSIGKAVSHGCVRMRNNDIATIFEHVKVGDSLWVRGHAIKVAKRTPVKTPVREEMQTINNVDDADQNTTLVQESTKGKMF